MRQGKCTANEATSIVAVMDVLSSSRFHATWNGDYSLPGSGTQGMFIHNVVNLQCFLAIGWSYAENQGAGEVKSSGRFSLQRSCKPGEGRLVEAAGHSS